MPARFLIGSVIAATILSVNIVYSGSYTVQKNDTLWGIARKFNVPSERIIKINDLTRKHLQVGQKLVIPDRIVCYTVKNGDNLSRIAADNRSKLQYIIIYNNLPDEKIYPGMKINIPVTEGPAMVKPTAPVNRTQPVISVKKAVSYHKVVKGDTLTSLSEQFNVSISEIMEWNRKKNASIFIGEKLKIISDTQDKKEEVIARAETKPAAPRSSLKLDNPGSFDFPMGMDRIDRLTMSGRGAIVYMDAGSEIKSIQNGVVEYAGKMTGYNSVVIVNYGNDERAIYGFLNEVRVKEGDNVSRGQAIGSVSQATYLGQIQFYFEIRKGKENVSVLDVFPSLRNGDILAKK